MKSPSTLKQTGPAWRKWTSVQPWQSQRTQQLQRSFGTSARLPFKMEPKNTSHTKQQPKSVSPGLQQKSANSSTSEIKFTKGWRRLAHRNWGKEPALHCPETELLEIHKQHLHWRECEQPDYEEQVIWSNIKHQRSSKSVFGDGKRYTEEEFLQKLGMHDWLPSYGGHWDLWASSNVAAEPESTQGLWPRWHMTMPAEGVCQRLHLHWLFFSSPPCSLAQFQLTGEMHTSHLSTSKESNTTLNYRLVSLTSVVCKLLAHIIVSAVMQHF